MKPAHDHPSTGVARRVTVDALIEAGAVAVLRLPDATDGESVVDALLTGGVRAIEVTLTTSGALDLIAALSRTFGDALLLGAGSVLSPERAQQAIDAGARYIVSPVFDATVMATAQPLGIAVLPGAFTPTEIVRAHQAGADLVKVFPADSLAPTYIRSVLAPLPQLELMPTGGVTPDNVGEWIAAGAAAVGLGSALVSPALVRAGDFAGIAERARRVMNGIAHARAARRTG